MNTLRAVKEAGQFSCNTSHINRMCAKISATPSKVYDLIIEYGGMPDSHTRETIFSYIAKKYDNNNYNRVYDAWMGA